MDKNTSEKGCNSSEKGNGSEKKSIAQGLFGDINPKLASLTDDVLFGDIWSRPELSPRDRSLVTLSALISMNKPDELKAHFKLALDNGLSCEELIEMITHLAFYLGWPCAISSTLLLKEVINYRQG